MKLHGIALLSCLGVCLLTDAEAVSYAQKFDRTDIAVGGKNFYGLALNANPYRQSNGYMTYDVEVGFQSEPADSCDFARSYGYPMLSVGISVSKLSDFVMDGDSFLPDIYSVYGGFERTLVRRERFSSGFLLNLGVTTNPGVYDPVSNPGNTFLSSPVMCYFGGGFFAKWHFARRWEAGVEVMYRHYSNGMLSVPNGGMDVVGGGVFARYRLSDYSAAEFSEPKRKPDFKRGMMYHIAFSGGVHSCRSEFLVYNEMVDDPLQKQTKFKRHPKFCLSADAMYRYALKYATGLSLDLYYSSNMKELEACDRMLYGDEAVETCPGYDPVSVGVAVVQELYWRNLAGYIALGVYPYRHKGIRGYQGWHYEKAGLRYYFPRLGDTFLGFAIKAHSFRAENFEFTIGKRFGVKR